MWCIRDQRFSDLQAIPAADIGDAQRYIFDGVYAPDMGELPPGQFWGHRFVIYTINGVPDIGEDRYSFELFGLVERSLSITYSELSEMAKDTLHADFHCVTRWSMRDNEWKGVMFSALAEKARIRGDAAFAFVYSLDGYTTVIPLENMDGAIIALELNGEKLSDGQGAPARLVVPSLYGWKSAKWVNAIELISEYRDGYWEERGYHERGDFNTEERFKDPRARFIHKKVARSSR